MRSTTRHHGTKRSYNNLRECIIALFIILILQPCFGSTITRPANKVRARATQDRVHFEPNNMTFPDSLASKKMKVTRALQTANKETAQKDFGGLEECPCIDATKILSTITDCVTDAGLAGASAFGGCYPVDYGTTCAAHDMTDDPVCAEAGSNSSTNATAAIPSYCYDRWCYVDFNKCKLSDEYFYRSAFDNSGLFYSYSTCSSVANGWLEYQTRSSVDQVTLQVTIPRISYPAHFKYTEDGSVAKDDYYYYNESIPWAGSIIDYLNAVAEISNMDGVQFTSRSNGADRAHPESSYTASVHDVSAGISDVGGGTFWITSQRLSMTTFSTPFDVDRIHLFVKQPESEKGTVRESAEKIAMPFTLHLWILLVFVVFLTAVLIVCLDRTEGDSGIWSDKTAGPYWNKSSPQRKLGIILKSSLDSFIIHASHMLGHAVEFDPMTSMAQKIVYFGFAVVIFIAVAAYTANLAAFLTLSGNVNYVSNMEEAIATNTPICANPVLEEEYAAAWPGASFVYNRTAEASGFESIMAMMNMYDAGLCSAIGYQFESSVLINQQIMGEFCKRNLASTGSFILEKPLAFPVRSEYAAGLSYWLYEAEKQSISYQYFAERRFPAPLCNLRVSNISPDVNELLSLEPASMILPVLVWLCCIGVAFVVHALRSRQKRIREEKWKNRNGCGARGSSGEGHRSVSYLSRPSLRYRERGGPPTTDNNQLFSDLLQQQHMEIMQKLSQMTGNNNNETASTETAEPTEDADPTETKIESGESVTANHRLEGDDNDGSV